MSKQEEIKRTIQVLLIILAIMAACFLAAYFTADRERIINDRVGIANNEGWA